MTIELIKKAAADYDASNETTGEQRTERFKTLVEKYGVDNVCAATGLKCSSVVKYTQKNNYPIAMQTLVKAETILGKYAVK
jgi:hypothetical protein